MNRFTTRLAATLFLICSSGHFGHFGQGEVLVHAADRPPSPWMSGQHFQKSEGPLRKMLRDARSIYIGYNGYFDNRLRWHDLPRNFSDRTIMARPGILAIYRKGQSLAHRINLQVASELNQRYDPAMIGHMFTHTGGRLSIGKGDLPQINIAGQALSYPSNELNVSLLLLVLRRYFMGQPRHLWPHTRRTLERAEVRHQESEGIGYSEDKDRTALFFYVFHAVYSAVTRDREWVQATGHNRTSAAFMTHIAPWQRPPLRGNSRYAFSLVPFWRNDLDWYCLQQLRRGVALGFRKVALFYPIHYSIQHRNGLGSQFRYLELAALPQTELNRCLRRIMQAGLDLHFVPHLEDAKTIISNWEVEWRINAGIPLDQRYYKRAFGPLLRYLRSHKALVKRWSRHASLRVTVAAEVDRMVFLQPTHVRQTTQKLARALHRTLGHKVPLIWNPNGDLAAVIGDARHKRPPAQRCKELIAAFRTIDGIAPTIYGQYDHLGQTTKSKGLFVATRDKFIEWLRKAAHYTCHTVALRQRLMAQWQRMISHDFSFGELALRHKGQHSYWKLHQDFLRHGGSEMILWTTARWDPIGISRTWIPNPRHKRQILMTLQPPGNTSSSNMAPTSVRRTPNPL